MKNTELKCPQCSSKKTGNKCKIKYEDSTLQYCYEMGWDSSINGANTTNCNFNLFSSPDRKKAWEKGRAYGQECKISRSPSGDESPDKLKVHSKTDTHRPLCSFKNYGIDEGLCDCNIQSQNDLMRSDEPNDTGDRND